VHLKWAKRSYQRTARSLRHKQQPEELDNGKAQLTALKKRDAGLIDVCHLDEAGFSMTLPPCRTGFPVGKRVRVPYEVPQSRRVNVTGAHFTHGPAARRCVYQRWTCLPKSQGYQAAQDARAGGRRAQAARQ